MEDTAVGLIETEYDDQTAQFTESLAPVVTDAMRPPHYFNQPRFVMGKDRDKRLWLLYTSDGVNIKASTRAVGEAWSSPQTIFTGPSQSVPIGINFIDGNCLPVVFVERTFPLSGPVRLYAISPNVPYWTGESILIATPPPPPVRLEPNSPFLTYQGAVVNRTLCLSNYVTVGQQDPPGSIAVDEDGFVYAPQMPWGTVTIHPPGSTGPASNVVWGGGRFREFTFSLGAAVDNARGKVYFANRPICGSEYDMIPSEFQGHVSVWDRSLRDENCGWGPTTFTCNYTVPNPLPASAIVGLGWPSDVAVDETHGLLYVVEGMRSKVNVYVAAGVIYDYPIFLGSFGTEGSGPGEFRFPKGIDVDKDGNVYIVDSGNNRIQKWVYNPATGFVDFMSAWGSAGRGPGQFLNPVGLEMDIGSDRV